MLTGDPVGDYPSFCDDEKDANPRLDLVEVPNYVGSGSLGKEETDSTIFHPLFLYSSSSLIRDQYSLTEWVVVVQKYKTTGRVKRDEKSVSTASL